jgi:hypothetical protein
MLDIDLELTDSNVIVNIQNVYTMLENAVRILDNRVQLLNETSQKGMWVFVIIGV